MPGHGYATQTVASRRDGVWAKVVAATGAARECLALWRKRTHDRRALARMSERELSDIGVSWSDIAGEVGKPFWRP